MTDWTVRLKNDWTARLKRDVTDWTANLKKNGTDWIADWSSSENELQNWMMKNLMWPLLSENIVTARLMTVSECVMVLQI